MEEQKVNRRVARAPLSARRLTRAPRRCYSRCGECIILAPGNLPRHCRSHCFVLAIIATLITRSRSSWQLLFGKITSSLITSFRLRDANDWLWCCSWRGNNRSNLVALCYSAARSAGAISLPKSLPSLEARGLDEYERNLAGKFCKLVSGTRFQLAHNFTSKFSLAAVMRERACTDRVRSFGNVLQHHYAARGRRAVTPCLLHPL